jgi:SAM-dependent methyltransferase
MKWVPSAWFILRSRLAGKYFLYEFYFRGKKTLDIGCGEGEFLKHDTTLIEGFDPNERVVERLRKERYTVACADGSALPYADASFAMAHCHNVIEHVDIPTALSMLREAQRILIPGGSLVLSSEVVTKKFWHTFGHVKPYPPEAVIKLLRHDSRESFEALEGFEVVGLFFIGDVYKNKLLYFVSFFIGYFTPLFRREYFLVLRKTA